MLLNHSRIYRRIYLQGVIRLNIADKLLTISPHTHGKIYYLQDFVFGILGISFPKLPDFLEMKSKVEIH